MFWLMTAKTSFFVTSFSSSFAPLNAWYPPTTVPAPPPPIAPPPTARPYVSAMSQLSKYAFSPVALPTTSCPACVTPSSVASSNTLKPTFFAVPVTPRVDASATDRVALDTAGVAARPALPIPQIFLKILNPTISTPTSIPASISARACSVLSGIDS